MVSELKSLNDKITSMAGVQKEMSTLGGEVGKLRHDLRNAENAINGMPLLQKMITENQNKIAALTAQTAELMKWKDKHEGAAGAIASAAKALWTLFGGGVMALGYFLLRAYFTPGR